MASALLEYEESMSAPGRPCPWFGWHCVCWHAMCVLIHVWVCWPCPSAWGLVLPSHRAPRSERCFKWDKEPRLATGKLGFSSKLSRSGFGEVPLPSLGLKFLIVKCRGTLIPAGHLSRL